LKTHTDDSLVINIAGRQRMLSQRIFKEWLLDLEMSAKMPQRHSIKLFQQSIKALIEGGEVNLSLVGEKPVVIPPAPDRQTRESLKSVQRMFNDFVQDLESLSDLKEENRTRRLQELANLNRKILLAMDESVSALQENADKRVLQIKYLHYVILTVTFVLFTITLFFVYYNITKPLQNFIQQQDEDYQELNRLCQALDEQQKKLNDQLILGRKVHQRILPAKVFAREGLIAHVLYQPLQTLGGDYYDFFQLADDKVGILIVDAMGKGVSAALMTAMAKVIFISAAKVSSSPGYTLSQVSRLLYQLTGGESYLTACYLVVDKESDELVYAAAGHPSGLIFNYENETMDELVSEEVLIGISGELELTERKVSIKGRMRILLYTDGVIEQMDKDKKPVGLEYLKLLFLEQLDQEPHAGLVQMTEKFQQKANEEKTDDITMIIVDIEKGRKVLNID
jgi:serine phosphatase RsbU (regulator of sigma subunit)